MWSKMVFRNIETIYLPLIEEWQALPEEARLPVYLTKGGILSVCMDNITAANCSGINVLTRNGVDPICIHCIHSISCSVNKRGNNDAFEPDKDLDPANSKYKWDQVYIRMLQDTLQVPFLTLFINLADKLRKNSHFELEFLSDLNEIRFDLYRLRKNIGIILDSKFSTLVKYKTISTYADENGFFRHKIGNITKSIESHDLDSFKKAIETMQL